MPLPQRQDVQLVYVQSPHGSGREQLRLQLSGDSGTRPAGLLAGKRMSIENLRPVDTPEYMTPAWLGCISWALNTPEVVAAFRAATGNQWQPGRSGLERMIDEATGADRHFIEAFIRWVKRQRVGADGTTGGR